MKYNNKNIIGKTVTVTVDRPLGSRHPKFKDMVYPVNYGYIYGIKAPDGDWQDAYVLVVNKPVKTFTGKVVAIIHRNDDVEEKWVVASDDKIFTKEQIAEATFFQERYFDSEVKTWEDLK